VYFLSLLEDIEHDENTSVIPSSSDLLRRGVELFRQRPDNLGPSPTARRLS